MTSKPIPFHYKVIAGTAAASLVTSCCCGGIVLLLFGFPGYQVSITEGLHDRGYQIVKYQKSRDGLSLTMKCLHEERPRFGAGFGFQVCLYNNRRQRLAVVEVPRPRTAANETFTVQVNHERMPEAKYVIVADIDSDIRLLSP